MIRVSDIMIKEEVFCTPVTKIKESKKLMQKYHCSKIPVVNSLCERKIIGIVGSGSHEDEAKVIEHMSKVINVVEEDSSVNDCLRVMILKNIEQITVTDKQGHYCGIVTQEDLIKS